jgi:hypothetical protein
LRLQGIWPFPIRGELANEIRIAPLSYGAALAAVMTPSTREKSKITKPYIVKSAKIRAHYVLAHTANRCASEGFAKSGGSDFSLEGAEEPTAGS